MEPARKTTTWSDPVAVLDGYAPLDPRETRLDTAASILDHWDGLGRDLKIRKVSDYYTVAEMDGCEEEMEFLANKFKAMVASPS